MVRRWSYLNSINRSFWLKPLYQHVERHVKGYNLTTFKGTTFFRKSLYLTAPTKLSRKSFYRRRHLNNFLFYFNIISAWSQEYLFFKKLNKTLLMFGFYKNLYLAQNTLLFSKKSMSETIGFEGLKITSVYTSLIRYITTSFVGTNSFATTFKQFSLLYVTSPDNWSVLKKQKIISEGFLYNYSNKGLSSLTQASMPITYNYQNLMDLIYRVSLNSYGTLYQVIIMLVYKQITGKKL